MILSIFGRDLFAFCVGQDGEISTSDVESDAAQRNLVLVGDHSADWLGVTFVTVGAKHAALAAGRHAGFNLFDRRRVVLAEDFRPFAATWQ